MASQEHDSSAETRVTLGRYVVSGQRQGGIDSFMGIPYAPSPVGGRRFAQAQPLEVSAGTIIDARTPSPSVPQPPSRMEALMGQPSGHYDEHGSLTLNIWAPEGAANRPVLFWLHGGAFVSGSAAWSWYDGARLAAAQDIVVVTANYRLGVLGYLDLRAQSGPGSESGANFALSDQMTALEWVSANIAAFGGDPTLITIGGQSAGAESAALIAGSERTRHLIRRVLLQSGGAHGWIQPPQHSEALAEQYLAVLSQRIEQPVNLDLLRSLPVSDLLDAQVDFLARRAAAGESNPPFGITNGSEVPAGGTRAFLRSRSDLDLLAGWARDELLGFARMNPASTSITESDAASALAAQYGDNARPLLEHYRAARPSASPSDLAAAINGDAIMMIPMLNLADDRAANGASTFLYRFDWSGAKYGACHCVDLPFLFGTFDHWMPGAPMLAGAEPAEVEAVSEHFMDMTGSFVRTGAPRIGDVDWTPWGREAAVVRLGGHAPSAEIGLGLAERGAWTKATSKTPPVGG